MYWSKDVKNTWDLLPPSTEISNFDDELFEMDQEKELLRAACSQSRFETVELSFPHISDTRCVIMNK